MARKARVKVPASAKKGEIIEIKTLIPHKMETRPQLTSLKLQQLLTQKKVMLYKVERCPLKKIKQAVVIVRQRQKEILPQGKPQVIGSAIRDRKKPDKTSYLHQSDQRFRR